MAFTDTLKWPECNSDKAMVGSVVCTVYTDEHTGSYSTHFTRDYKKVLGPLYFGLPGNENFEIPFNLICNMTISVKVEF